MDDEPTSKDNEKREGVNNVSKEPEQPLSIVDEAKKVRDEIKAENDRRELILREEQKLASDKLLGGTGGGRVEAEPAKEETAKEYSQRISKGDLKEGEGVASNGE